MKRLLNTLYVTNPDALVRKKDDAISVSVDGKQIMSVPFHVLEGVVLFGHVGCSAAFLSACAEHGVGVVLLDERGRFKARVEGPVSGNVLLRREQYRRADDEDARLRLAKRLLLGKLHNSVVVLQHYVRDYPELHDELDSTIEALQSSTSAVLATVSHYGLLGIEGDSAHRYFSVFGTLLRVESPEGLFSGRSRRPPKDPVNAALSLFYSMLSRELTTACESVGLDPQLGYLHSCRPGRASLALDLIEELRAPYVDRFVLSLFNRRQIDRTDFSVDAEGGYSFNERSLKKVLGLWQQRKQEEIMHPFLKQRIPMGLIPFTQAQLLARHLRGDLDDYPAYMWR